MGNQNGHRTTYPGVYSCTLDVASGRCDESMPLNIVVDSVHTDQTRKRGVDVSNLKLSASKDMLFALRTDNLWEILRAPLAGDTDDDATSSGSTATFHSYFRIPKLVYTDPNKGYTCANYYADGTAQNQRFAYYEVLPVAFSVDESDDVYISWEGYFQDCKDEEVAGDGLVWSIGVNKVDKRCVTTDYLQSFSNCTTPAAIFYRGLIGKDRRLGNGLAFSSSPSGRQLIYLSAINRAFGVDGVNELWVAPDGIHKRPTVVPAPGIPSVSAIQATRIIPDVASVALNLDSNQLPRGYCQTVYNEGVYCYKFRIEDDGETLNATTTSSELMFMVSKEQIEGSCAMDTSVNAGEWWMSGLSTGLEVIWGADGRPDAVLFGCYGRLSGQGNMTAVLRDGSVVQTLTGAYPGSLLFGVDVIRDPEDSIFFRDDDRVNPQDNYTNPFGKVESRTYEGKQSHTVMIVSVVLGALFLLVLVHITNVVFCRKSSSTKEIIGSSALHPDERKETSDIMARDMSSVASHRTPSLSNSDGIDEKRIPSDIQFDLETGSISVQDEEVATDHKVRSLERAVDTDMKRASVACAPYDSSDDETCDDDLSLMVEMLHGSKRPIFSTSGDIRMSTEKPLPKKSIPHSVMIPHPKSPDGSCQVQLDPNPRSWLDAQTLRIPDESSRCRRSFIMTPAGIMMNPLQSPNRMYKSVGDIRGNEPAQPGWTDIPVISEPDNRVSDKEVAGRPRSNRDAAKVRKSLSHEN